MSDEVCRKCGRELEDGAIYSGRCRIRLSDVTHMVGLLEPPDATEGFELIVH